MSNNALESFSDLEKIKLLKNSVFWIFEKNAVFEAKKGAKIHVKLVLDRSKNDRK